MFKNILHRRLTLDIVLPKAKLQAPHYLSRVEIRQRIDACTDVRLKTMTMLCYGCGLRIGKLMRVRVQDIDGKSKTILITHGKGNKSRYVVVPESVLYQFH